MRQCLDRLGDVHSTMHKAWIYRRRAERASVLAHFCATASRGILHRVQMAVGVLQPHGDLRLIFLDLWM